MIKVTAPSGDRYEFDADSWQSEGSSLKLFKTSKLIAEFSSFLMVQEIPSQVSGGEVSYEGS